MFTRYYTISGNGGGGFKVSNLFAYDCGGKRPVICETGGGLEAGKQGKDIST